MTGFNGELPVSVSHLQKRYGALEVLKGLDLRVPPGAIYGLVGLNGSGKTTTLECLLGLQRRDGGRVSLLGYPPEELFRSRGAVVGIFDTPSLHPNLTVRQSLEHARLLCPRPARSCEEVGELLGIGRYSGFKVRHLSLGNRRRASIAHGLLGRPELIILDEPFNGLDAEGVDDVLRLIRRLNREEGTAFVLSSHQLPYLEQICTHMGILHRGAIALDGEVGALLARRRPRLLVRCREEDDERTVSLVAASGKADYRLKDEAGYLCFELNGGAPEEVNACLVGGGVGVRELMVQRASLASLFRDVTGGRE